LSSISNAVVGAPVDATNVTFYSDSACSVGVGNVQLSQGDSHAFFYVKIPLAYTRSPYFPSYGFKMSYALVPTAVTSNNLSQWFYAVE
jgi:hypothetical protein